MVSLPLLQVGRQLRLLLEMGPPEEPIDVSAAVLAR